MSEVKFLFIYYPSSYLWVSWDGWEKVDVGLNQSPQMQMIDSRFFGDDIFRQQLTNAMLILESVESEKWGTYICEKNRK